MTQFICTGGLRIDYLITRAGQAYTDLVGGNALYAAVGAALWSHKVGLWARYGSNYPTNWLQQLNECQLDITGLVQLASQQEHRTFFAYTPEGQRDDTNPVAHFARIRQPLPPALTGYIHSTMGQDDPHTYEPLAPRPTDWPKLYNRATAVHLSPISLCTHLHVPPFLRQRGIQTITIDPGERYMVPNRLPFIQQLLPYCDAFLPSHQEVRSLLGNRISLWDAAEQFCMWGAPLVIIKNGAEGILILEGTNGPRHHLPAYHTHNDPRIVDVTGAGDAFCGGFMVGLAQTNQPLQAAQMGLVSASLVIEGYGALYARRRRTEAQSRLTSYKTGEL